MVTLNKNIPGSPPIEYNQSQLQQEVNDNITITKTCLGITHRGNDIFVSFDFDTTLSAEEETELESVFATHIINESRAGTHNLLTFDAEIKTDSYKRVSSYVYEGKDEIGSPYEIDAIVYVDDGSAGEVRIYDKTNKTILGSQIFTNTEEKSIEIQTTGWPASKALIEVQIRRTSGKKNVYINGMAIGY